MYYEASYRVTSITETENVTTFSAKKHGRRSMKGRTNISDLELPECLDIGVGDVMRLKIENHSGKSGSSKRSWSIDRFIGFPYEKERGWEPLDGLC
jgi:hypothetical protein